MSDSSVSTTELGLRARLARGETLLGTFLNTGSAVAAEICGGAGFDWVVIDLEHGSGSEGSLLHLLQAAALGGARPIVRIEANERPRFSRALDFGAEGIMVPRVETELDARAAASHLRYPPDGIRGVQFANRAWAFGNRGDETVADLNARVLGVVQIESAAAIENAEAIAAVDGLDVLFIGPSDLSLSLGILGDTAHHYFQEAIKKVARAVERSGKAGGIVVRNANEIDIYVEFGFRLIAVGSDGHFLASAAREAALAARARCP